MNPLKSERLSHLSVFVLAIACMSIGGCAIFQPSKNSPEYDAAKRDIETYTDDEGNYVRPEGARAEKKKKSKGSLSFIPGFGDKPADKEGARKAYAEGEALFNQAKDAKDDERVELFVKAAKKFKEAGKLWRSSALEQDSLMMAGESYFFAEKYPDAEDEYVTLIKEYPRTKFLDKSDQRRMEIALFYLQTDAVDPKQFYELNLTDRRYPWNDTRKNGVRIMEKMRTDNPTGKLADDVTMELATEAFRKKDYINARETFEDLRVTYPDSPHQFEAHFLGLKAAMETYQGPQYAEEPIAEAEKLIKAISKQFPKEFKEHREYLNRAYSEIRYKKAERLYDQASYRMQRAENNAARVYFDQILTEYNDTPIADQARLDLARIEPLPGEPERYFRWLANMFPESSKTKPLLDSKEDAR